MTAPHLFIALALLATAVAPAAAQNIPTTLEKARVTLVDGPAPSRGARTEVIRHATRIPRNVVVVGRNASADDLAAAIALLDALRLQHGDSLTIDYRARPAAFRGGPAFVHGAYRRWLVEQLVRLRQAPVTNVPGLGSARAVDITIAPPRGTVSAARRGP